MAPFLTVNLHDHDHTIGTSSNHQVDNHHSLVTVVYFVSGMHANEEPTMTYSAVRFSSMIGHGSV